MNEVFEPSEAPLVVTLALPDEAQAELDALRRRWFPAGRTQVGAHLTLFHAVPGRLETQVRQDLAAAVDDGALGVRFTRVVSLGRGAAYTVESPDLVRRHAGMQRAWWSALTRQDQQSLRPHVTLQNKVEPAVARETVRSLQSTFRPFEVEAPGFDLWRYDGGPWTRLEQFRG